VHKTADDYRSFREVPQPAAEKLPKAVDNLNATLVSTRRLADDSANPNGTVMPRSTALARTCRVAADSVQQAAGIFTQETLPQINGLARESRQAAQHRPRRRPVQRQAKQRAVRRRRHAWPGRAGLPGA
jgi:phospholipid/cholesterol/gamma-HCH transport system substrate-binding protein